MACGQSACGALLRERQSALHRRSRHSGGCRALRAQYRPRAALAGGPSRMSNDTVRVPARRLRAGIVGGGRGALIGAVHRIAAELDGQAEVIAGALSSDARIARESAAEWVLARSYASYEEMAAAEAADANGIDFVIIATPNDLHFPVARTFLEADIHVICDKPLALTVAEGEALVRLVEAGSTLFALTHPYTGYPAVRQARELVR